MSPVQKTLSGKLLNDLWRVGAKHALYREDGKWYHHLTEFPGALFDANGYIVFQTERDYLECPYLQLGQDLNIPSGISSIPGYVRVTERNQFQAFSRNLKETADQSIAYSAQPQATEDYQLPLRQSPQAADLLEEPDETKRASAQVLRIIRDTEIARRVKLIHNYRCQICGDSIFLGNKGQYAEAHHIKPLGGKHRGPDVVENILCVCPNHHVLLDYGAVVIEKSQLRLAAGHSISDAYIQYHNTVIYMGGAG